MATPAYYIRRMLSANNQDVSDAAPLPVKLIGSGPGGGTSVGGFTALVQLVPAVQQVAYAVNQSVGGLLSFPNATRVAGGSGMIQAVTIANKSAQAPVLDVVFFNANPTASAFADRTAAALAAADVGKVVLVAHPLDNTAIGTPVIQQAGQLAQPFALAAGTTLFGLLVTRGAFTPGSTTDFTVTVHLLQD